MSFNNEGAVEIEVAGDVWYEARTFDGGFIGHFCTEAAALGAQREANKLRIVITKASSSNETRYQAFSCECHFDNGEVARIYQLKAGPDWYGPSESLADLLNDAGFNHGYGR